MGWRPDRRSSGSIASLAAGMVLMILGFFMYAGGDPPGFSIFVMGAGFACEVLGLFLAYLAYKASRRGSNA